MVLFSLIGERGMCRTLSAIVAWFALSMAVSAQTAPVARVPAATTTARQWVLLLPTDQPLLRRAALAVRDGARAALNASGAAVELRDCTYGNDGVVLAYQRCVGEDVDAVIGPLGRSDVGALVASAAKLSVARPTLMLSPLGAAPPPAFYVLAPELESEAQAIARQSLEDACRKPILVESGGATATRISVEITGYFKSGGVSTPLMHHTLGPRERWHQLADSWRKSGVDCVLYAGSGASFGELRPFLRNITAYITSASYEAPLDRLVDWSGVRIADVPFLLDPSRADFAAVAAGEPISPTLSRLFALGVDAARLTMLASEALPLQEQALPIASTRESEKLVQRGKRAPDFAAPSQFDGAIGRLQLRDGHYQRTPLMGEFRGRAPLAIGL